MQKILIIATVSLVLFFSSCRGGTDAGPPTLLKEDLRKADISIEDFIESNGKISSTHHLGPFNLPAKTNIDSSRKKPASVRFNIDTPVWIISFEPSVVDSDGNPLPSELIHQILLINHAEPNTFCQAKQTGNPFAAATSTMEKIELPDGTGYAIVPTDPLEARLILKNPIDKDYFNVFVKFTLTGLPMNDTKAIRDVLPMMVDIDPCDHEPMSIAPGQFVEKTAEVYVPEAGRIVKAYGFLYDYGVGITMDINGKSFWDGVVQIDENHKIRDIPIFEDGAGVQVMDGDKLGITVTYNNTSRGWYDGAIGSSLVYLVRDVEKLTAPASGAGTEGRAATSAVSIQQELL